MADAGSAAAFQQAHFFARLEYFSRFLHYCHDRAAVQFHRDLNAILAGNAFFRCRTCQAACYAIDHR